MKRLYIFAALVVTSAVSYSQVVFQDRFDNWAATNPTQWVGIKTSLENDSIIQITTGTVYGNNAAQLVNEESTHMRFTTQPLSVTKGDIFTFEFWAKGQGDIRTGIFDDRSTGFGYSYNSYINVSGNTWQMYSQTLAADSTVSNAEFILSIRNTVPGSGHLQIDSVSIYKSTVPFTSIYNIQYTTAPSGDSPLNGQIVSTGGVVTGVHSAGYFIQDGAGAWNGIYVFDNSNTPTRGDSVTVTATVDEYFGWTELKNVSAYNVESTGNAEPAPVQFNNVDSVNLERYESVLVEVLYAGCTDPNAGFGMWTLKHAQDSCKVHDLLFTYNTPVLGTFYDVKGPVSYSFSEARICPRENADVKSYVGINERVAEDVMIYPNPAYGILNVKGVENMQMYAIVDQLGKVVKTGSVIGRQIDIQDLSAGSYHLMFPGTGIQTERLVVIKFN